MIWLKFFVFSCWVEYKSQPSLYSLGVILYGSNNYGESVLWNTMLEQPEIMLSSCKLGTVIMTPPLIWITPSCCLQSGNPLQIEDFLDYFTTSIMKQNLCSHSSIGGGVRQVPCLIITFRSPSWLCSLSLPQFHFIFIYYIFFSISPTLILSWSLSLWCIAIFCSYFDGQAKFADICTKISIIMFCIYGLLAEMQEIYTQAWM